MPNQSVHGLANGGHRLQPLAPRPPAVNPRQSEGVERDTRAVVPQKKRTQSVRAACEGCKIKKVKCNAQRPSCAACTRSGRECVYIANEEETQTQALKRRSRHLEQVYALLKTRPDREAQDILQRIRAGNDLETILAHIETADLLLEMRLVPETRFRYEFPHLSRIPQDHVSNNPYLDSLIYEVGSLYPIGDHLNPTASNPPSPPVELRTNDSRDPYLKPFHAAQVFDALLSDARISQWTVVCDDNMLMQDLLRVFFHCEYHFTAAFQKDYFLEDMNENRQDFCSSLLVNVVLAYACVCYPAFHNRAEYWNPRTLHYRFLAEAKRLWELEATKGCITTIQAGIIFNVIHNLSGIDEIGDPYRVNAVALAHKIRLFDTVDAQSSRIQDGRAFTAWALFNWETLVGFSFMKCPLLNEPPNWPLPNPLTNKRWYGEIWVKYPMAHELVPSHFSQVFTARCQFRIIMNEFCHQAYSNGSQVRLDQANQLHSKLKEWYAGLPVELLPKSIVFPGHLQLHMYYHHLLLAIYEPLLDAKPEEAIISQQIVADATKYLQTLVRLYYLRHGFEAMDLFIVIPLMLIAYESINIIDKQASAVKLEVLQSTLILVTKGLHSQCRNHYLAKALFRVIRGRMKPRELGELKKMVKFDDEDSIEWKEMEQAVRSRWPVSVVRKKEDMESHILANLVDDYASLNLE